jgi:hypothetical protein
VELETAIRVYIDAIKEDPKPFRWTKSDDDISRPIKRFCLETLEIASTQTEIARNSESGHQIDVTKLGKWDADMLTDANLKPLQT